MKIFGRKFKYLAQLAVLIISGIFHEYVFSFAFGSFFPVMGVSYIGLAGLLFGYFISRPIPVIY